MIRPSWARRRRRYFVAYVANTGTGEVVHSWSDVTRRKPIATGPQLQGLAEAIRDDRGFVEVIVADWRRFEDR